MYPIIAHFLKMFHPLLFFKIIVVIVHGAIFIRLITELFQHFESNR